MTPCQVSSRYLSSPFVGHSTAESIMENLEASRKNENDQPFVGFNTDGLSINWSFLEKLTSYHHDEFKSTMFFLGSYGLDFINGALKTSRATVKLEVKLLLRLFYKLFKDASAC